MSLLSQNITAADHTISKEVCARDVFNIRKNIYNQYVVPGVVYNPQTPQPTAIFKIHGIEFSTSMPEYEDIYKNGEYCRYLIRPTRGNIHYQHALVVCCTDHRDTGLPGRKLYANMDWAERLWVTEYDYVVFTHIYRENVVRVAKVSGIGALNNLYNGGQFLFLDYVDKSMLLNFETRLRDGAFDD